MKTTWHLLNSSFMAQVLQSGWGAYEGYLDAAYPPYSAFVDRAAGVLRKISPSDGDYKKAGWREEQIDI